jgi:hypothetical protein
VKVAILEPSPGAGVFPAKVHKRWPNICLQRLAIISKNSRRTKTWIGSICSRHRSLGSRTLTGLTFAEHWQSAARDQGIIHADRFYRESAALLSSGRGGNTRGVSLLCRWRL